MRAKAPQIEMFRAEDPPRPAPAGTCEAVLTVMPHDGSKESTSSRNSGKRDDRRAIGGGRVAPEFLHVLVRDSRAAGAQVEHGGRRDRELRSPGSAALQEAEVFDHDLSRIRDLAGDHGNRRLLLGAAEPGPGIRLERHALELREEVEVPPVAAELAVGDGLQADRLLPGDHVANRVLLERNILALAGFGKPGRTEQAADLVGAKRRCHFARNATIARR